MSNFVKIGQLAQTSNDEHKYSEEIRLKITIQRSNDKSQQTKTQAAAAAAASRVTEVRI